MLEFKQWRGGFKTETQVTCYLQLNSLPRPDATVCHPTVFFMSQYNIFPQFSTHEWKHSLSFILRLTFTVVMVSQLQSEQKVEKLFVCSLIH